MSGPIYPILILLVISFLMLFLASYAVAQRRVRAAPEFAALMVSMIIYALSYIVELSSDDLSRMLAAIRFEYLGIAVLPPLWLLFSLRFSRVSYPHPAILASLFLIPLIVIALVWTNDFHHLFYVRTWVRRDGPFPVIGIERGPFYWLQISYLQLCSLAGNVVLIIHSIRSSPFLRRQSIMAVSGTLAPWIGNILYLFGISPWGLEPSVFFFAISASCFSLAIFRLGFFQVVPAARDRAIDSLRDGFIVLDAKEHIIDANEAAGNLLGAWACREGDNIPSEVPGGSELVRIFREDNSRMEFSLLAPDGQKRYLAAQSFPVSVGHFGLKGRAIIVRDVTENAILLMKLAELAGTDELTGLFNRRRFFEYATREFVIAVRDQKPIGVAMFDIDHFKRVNDRFGHAGGDEVLREFSSRLAHVLRETDILCRYGGEEFAMLFPGSDLPSTLSVAQRIKLSATQDPIIYSGVDLSIKVSVGIYSARPGKESSLDDFLAEADAALYDAKRMGRDRCVARE